MFNTQSSTVCVCVYIYIYIYIYIYMGWCLDIECFVTFWSAVFSKIQMWHTLYSLDTIFFCNFFFFPKLKIWELLLVKTINSWRPEFKKHVCRCHWLIEINFKLIGENHERLIPWNLKSKHVLQTSVIRFHIAAIKYTEKVSL